MAQHPGDTPGTPWGPADAQPLGTPWGHPPFREGREGTPTFLLAAQQQFVFVRAGVVVALHLEPIVGLEALRVLAVPQELLVVALQAAQDLPHLLGRQRAELGGHGRVSPCRDPWDPRAALGPPGTHRDVRPGLDLLDVPGQVLPGAEAAQVLVQLLPQPQQVLVGALQPAGMWSQRGDTGEPGGGHRVTVPTCARRPEPPCWGVAGGSRPRARRPRCRRRSAPATAAAASGSPGHRCRSCAPSPAGQGVREALVSPCPSPIFPSVLPYSPMGPGWSQSGLGSPCVPPCVLSWGWGSVREAGGLPHASSCPPGWCQTRGGTSCVPPRGWGSIRPCWTPPIAPHPPTPPQGNQP